MQSKPPLGRLRLLALALCLCSTTACVSTRLSPPIVASLRCGPLIPQSFRTPIPGPPRLSPDATAGDLGVFADQAVTALDQANGREADTLAIVDTCDANSAAVLNELNPAPWWKKLHIGKRR